MSRGCFGVLRGDLPSATRSFRLIPGQEHANDCITASILIDTFYGFRPIHPRGPGDGWPGPLTPLFPAPYGRGKLLNVTFQPYVPGQKDVMTATMLVPVAQRTGAPMLLLNLQPTESMDHASFDTGAWLAYCGACPLPEIANAFRRCGIGFRSVSGYLEDARAWARIESWIKAAGVRAALRHGRHGLMGHLYPGMMDVSTDPTLGTDR